MTEAPANTSDQVGPIGPGRLILVVGPSGAGKDTLLAEARVACADDPSILFPRRVITRQTSASEDNEEVSRDGFGQALANGEYAVHWQAHGHCYALRRAIDDELRAGRTVVANVSRTVIETMRHTYANVVVISVTAPPDVLAERLAIRGRHSDGKIEQRLSRVVDGSLATPDFTIVNVDRVEYHALQLLRIIRGDGACGEREGRTR